MGEEGFYYSVSLMTFLDLVFLLGLFFIFYLHCPNHGWIDILVNKIIPCAVLWPLQPHAYVPFLVVNNSDLHLFFLYFPWSVSPEVYLLYFSKKKRKKKEILPFLLCLFSKFSALILALSLLSMCLFYCSFLTLSSIRSSLIFTLRLQIFL